MASLHHHSSGRSPFWWCSFTLPDGTRAFRSTKKRKHGEAMEVCIAWEKAARLGRESRLTEVQARKVLNDILESAGQSPLTSVTVEEFLSQWVESKSITRAGGTAKRYKRTVKDFLAHLGAKAKANLASVSPRDIETFRDLQIKEGKSGITANMALKTLRIPFNVARRQGLILSNPAEAVDALQASNEERSPFSPQQLSALLAAADTEWRGMILFGACVGMRIGDAGRVKWSNIDFERKTVCFYPEKTTKGAKRKILEVPMLPDLEEYLLALPVRSHQADAPIFPALSKLRSGGCNGLSARFQKLMHRVGIYAATDTRDISGKGRRFNNLSFHSLRHTCVSLMANLNVSQEMRRKVTGHTSDAHERYTHIEIETLRQALKDFPSLLKTGRENS